MTLQMKLSLTDSLDCHSDLPAALFSFQLLSARWPRCTTTRTLLRAPLWAEVPIWTISQPPPTHDDIITIFVEVTSLLNTINLPMYKWATNSTHLQDIWRTQGLPVQTETQVLDMDWDTQSDTIHIEHTDITRALPERLEVTSRFYDPLGSFSPVAIVGKSLFQDTWPRGLAWDEILPPDIPSSDFHGRLNYISCLTCTFHDR